MPNIQGFEFVKWPFTPFTALNTGWLPAEYELHAQLFPIVGNIFPDEIVNPEVVWDELVYCVLIPDVILFYPLWNGIVSWQLYPKPYVYLP